MIYQEINNGNMKEDYIGKRIDIENGRISKLNFNQRNLTKFPEGIQYLSAITSLYLFDNQISSLPQGINFQNLEELNLMHNQFSSFPKKWENFPNLKKLCLLSNDINFFPRKIKGLEKLEEISFDYNRERDFPLRLTPLSFLMHLPKLCSSIFSKTFINLYYLINSCNFKMQFNQEKV